MSKLLLLSCVLVSIWLPIKAARDPNPRRGLRRVIFYMVAYNLFYVIASLYIYPRIAS